MPTFIGKPVTVAEDKQLQIGDTLRDFNLTATDLTKKSLSEFDGKKKVISIVPSIDTGICSTQTRTFNKELSELDDTVVITISVDLPFAQARWCGAEGLENAIMLSDYYDNSFGKDYGVLIEEWHLLALKIGNDTVLKLWLIAGVWPAPKITRVRKTAKDGAIKFNTVPETT